jgi:hypothetical protein
MPSRSIGVAGESTQPATIDLRPTRVAPSSFTVFTVPRMESGWLLAIAVNVESETASMNPNPKSGVDWRSAVQFLPLLKAELVGSQIGSVVEKVVRVASSCWHSDFLQLGCVIWQPSGVASRPLGKIVTPAWFCGPARRMLSFAKIWTGPRVVTVARTSLMALEPPGRWK